MGAESLVNGRTCAPPIRDLSGIARSAMSIGATQKSHADYGQVSRREGEEALVAVQGAARRPLALVESAFFDVVDLHDRIGSGEVEGEAVSGDEESVVALVDDQAERAGVAGSGGDRAMLMTAWAKAASTR
jgi:hypothetical protein